MADWFVSSVTYAAVSAWAASTAYTVGQFVRPTAAAAGAQYVFRCTTAGTTSGTEPTWPAANNGTVTNGGAVFTNVAGQSTYGWSAAAGTLFAISNAGNNRPVVGDRVFLSSDHSETNAGAATYWFNAFAAAFGVVQIISVNRAGSVPPVAADLASGAVISAGGNFILDAICETYWQGVTFTLTGTSVFTLSFNSGGNKAQYFKNCAIVLTNNNASSRISFAAFARITWDNTTLQFSHASQTITVTGGFDTLLTWLNTPSAIAGATIPTSLIAPSSTAILNLTARGVDLSALTGTLVTLNASAAIKVLLDSCRIASGLTRLSTPVAGQPTNDEVELVNCYDGTNTLNERYVAAGTVTTDRSTTLSGGAQDDVAAYSLKLVSSSRSDKFTLPLDSFWLDVENTAIGSSKTATVEIISSGSLNNDDIRLMLEYMGTSGTTRASFGDSLATVLTPAAALPTSTVTWNTGFTTFNPADLLNVTLSGGNLTATGTGQGGVRTITSISSGKYYWEFTLGTISNANTGVGFGTAAANLANCGPTPVRVVLMYNNGDIYIDNGGTVYHLGARSAGDVIGVAVDVTAQLVWFRVAPSGNWNSSGTANPATGTGGFSINTVNLSAALFPLVAPGASGDGATANFGASSFTGSVPSGFAAGLSGGTGLAKQKLQVTFTPQVAGRVRGLVRLGKVSTTVWVNPQVTIT
jgi:hypothetical protein